MKPLVESIACSLGLAALSAALPDAETAPTKDVVQPGSPAASL